MRTPDDPGFAVLEQRAQMHGATIHSVDDKGVFDTRVYQQMLAICRAAQVAIWHAHDYKSNFMGLLLRRFHKMALVTTVHGWVSRETRARAYYALDRWAFRATTV